MNQSIGGLVVVLYFLSMIALVCCGLDKKVPTNYSLLGVFTVCTSWMVAQACVRSKPLIVLEAATLTLAAVAGITYHAWTTSTDFTIFGPLISIFGFVFCTAGLLLSCFGYHLGLVYSVIGVILFSFYLLFDTQMIMGGDNKRQYQFDEDSYILAAVVLYLDIINIFLYILEILNEQN